MRRRGLSLLELISALALFGTLSAVLFSVLAERRRRMHICPTQTNLKQIALGFALYSEQYNPYFLTPQSTDQSGSLPGIRTIHFTFPTTRREPFDARPSLVQWDSQSTRIIPYWAPAREYFSKSGPNFGDSRVYSVGEELLEYPRPVPQVKESRLLRFTGLRPVPQAIDTDYLAAITAASPLKWSEFLAYCGYVETSSYHFVDGHVKWLSWSRTPVEVAAHNGPFSFGR